MENKNTKTDKSFLSRRGQIISILFFGLLSFLYCFFSKKHNYDAEPNHIHSFFCLPDNLFEVAVFLFGNSIANLVLILLWLLIWTLYFVCFADWFSFCKCVIYFNFTLDIVVFSICEIVFADAQLRSVMYN